MKLLNKKQAFYRSTNLTGRQRQRRAGAVHPVFQQVGEERPDGRLRPGVQQQQDRQDRAGPLRDEEPPRQAEARRQARHGRRRLWQGNGVAAMRER